MEGFYIAGIAQAHKSIPFPELFQDYTEQWNEQNQFLSLFPSEVPLSSEFVVHVIDCFLLHMHKHIFCNQHILTSRGHIQIRFHLSQICQIYGILSRTCLLYTSDAAD